MSNPNINSVSYNANSGVLTVTGSNFASSIVAQDLSLYGSSSATLSKNDVLSNLTGTGFTLTLSSADMLKVGAIFPLNGSNYNSTTTSSSTTINNYSYELYAASGWNGSGSLPVYDIQPLTVSGASTLTASGSTPALNLNDNTTAIPFSNINLNDTDSTDKLSAKLTLPAANGSLAGSGLSTAVVSGSSKTYTLSATSVSNLNHELNSLLFTPTLHEVAGGNTLSSSLSLTINGSNSSQDAISLSQTLNVSSTAAGISSVNYNAAAGVLTVKGVNLAAGIISNDLSLQAGSKSYTLSSSDQINALSASAFTLNLSSTEQTAVNALLNGNGTSNSAGKYILSATNGWDGATSPADTAPITSSYLTLGLMDTTSNALITDSTSIAPFKHLQLTDTASGASDSATLSFKAANGILSGPGLATSSLVNGIASYTLAATSANNLQQELNSLLFTPTLHQTSVGSSITSSFSLLLSSNDTAYGNSATLDSITDTNTKVTVAGSLPAAAINSVQYNAFSGILTVNGSKITTNIALNDIKLGVGSNSYTLNAAQDKIIASSAAGFTVQLGNSGQSTANSFFSNNGTGTGSYAFSAATGWDGAYSSAGNNILSVTHTSISLSGSSKANVVDSHTLNPFANLKVSDGNSHETLSATISFGANNGSLSGNGLTGSNGSYTLSAASAAALQTELRQLVFTPVMHLAAADTVIAAPITLNVTGSSSALNTTSLLDSVNITATAGPTIATASYNATSGVLTLTGSHFTKGVVLNDISLQSASNSFTLSASQDKLDKLTGSNLAITLSNADKALLNAFFSSNGNSNGSDSYTLATALNWDGKGSAAVTGQTVLVSGDNSITVTGLSTASVSANTISNPFANLKLTDSNVTDSDSVSISFTAGNGSLSGTGLAAAVDSGKLISYSLAATTAANLQSELHNLQFTPASGNSNTDFNLHFQGNIYTPATSPSLTISKGVVNPVSVITNSNGDIFVANNSSSGALGSGSVTEYSASGSLLHTLSSGISLPSSLAVDSQGNVYVANYATDSYGHGSVSEFSSSGTLLQTLTGMTDVQSVTVDKSGNIFVACLAGNIHASGYIEEFSAAGVLQRVLSSGVNRPESLTTDSNGNLFVANSGGNTVEEFSASGTLLHTLSTGVSSPSSVATDSNGNVFVANSGGMNVEEFSATGQLLQTYSSGLSNPDSVAVDSHGNVFIADNQNNTISEFSASGLLLSTLSNGVANPWSVTTDSNGNVYVANELTSSIEKFSLLLNPAYLTDNYSATESLTVTAGTSSAAAQIELVGVNSTAHIQVI